MHLNGSTVNLRVDAGKPQSGPWLALFLQRLLLFLIIIAILVLTLFVHLIIVTTIKSHSLCQVTNKTRFCAQLSGFLWFPANILYKRSTLNLCQFQKTQINHHCTGRGPTLDLLWKLIRKWMLRVRFAAFLVLSGDQIKPLCIFMSNYYCTAAVPTYFCTSLCVFLYFLCSCYSFSCTRVASLTRYAYSSPTMIFLPVMLLYIAQLW